MSLEEVPFLSSLMTNDSQSIWQSLSILSASIYGTIVIVALIKSAFGIGNTDFSGYQSDFGSGFSDFGNVNFANRMDKKESLVRQYSAISMKRLK